MKKTIQVYVHQYIAGFIKGDLFVASCDISDGAAVPMRIIAQVEIEIDVPDDNLDLAEIEALEAAIAKEKGESQHKVNLLLERISKLKAIGHEVAA